MEEYSTRKRKHSSSDEDDLDLDLDLKEQTKKLRENTKSEPENIMVKEEPGTSDASLSEQSTSFKSETTGIKEEFDNKSRIDYVRDENKHFFSNGIIPLKTIRPSFICMKY